ncbi:MAG: GtrA family protein [Dysgonomonas sp.]
MHQSLRQLVKYGIVGVIGLAVDWLFFFLFRDALGINYWVAHIMSSTLAILNNFLLNSYFTFKTTDKLIKRGVSFFGIAAVGLVVSSILLPLGVRFIDAHFSDWVSMLSTRNYDKAVQDLSKLSVTIIIAFLQFFANKFFTFKNKQQA